MANHGMTFTRLLTGLALAAGAGFALADGILDDPSGGVAEETPKDTGATYKSPPEFLEIDKLIDSGQYKQAIAKLRPLAEGGSSVAQYKLGGMYELGLGVQVDTYKAIELYEESIKSNYPRSHYRLGKLYMNGAPGLRNFCANSKFHLTQAANEGVKEASLALAKMYADGIACPADFKESLNWYNRAAEQGSADAQNYLGDIYYKGVPDYPPSKAEARQWYQKAADQGHPHAIYSLALMTINGQGDEPDVRGGCALLDKLLNSAETPDSLRADAMDSKIKGCANI